MGTRAPGPSTPMTLRAVSEVEALCGRRTDDGAPTDEAVHTASFVLAHTSVNRWADAGEGLERCDPLIDVVLCLRGRPSPDGRVFRNLSVLTQGRSGKIADRWPSSRAVLIVDGRGVAGGVAR